MDRRSFLKALTGATAAAAALVVDPDFLLWKPGAKTIFLPEHPGLYRPEVVIPKMIVEPGYQYELASGGEILRMDEKMRPVSARTYNPLSHRRETTIDPATLERIHQQLFYGR